VDQMHWYVISLFSNLTSNTLPVCHAYRFQYYCTFLKH